MPSPADVSRIIALACLAATAVAGCDSNEPQGPRSDEVGDGPWDTLDERPCPSDSIVSFENFGAPFMLDHCKGCHSATLPEDMRQMAPVDVNFDDLQDIRDQAQRIWARSADHNVTMPPVGGPSDEERRLLGEWLACGVPTDAEL